MDILNNAGTVWHVRRGVFLGVHRRLYRKRAGPVFPILEVLFMRTPFVTELPNLTW